MYLSLFCRNSLTPPPPRVICFRYLTSSTANRAALFKNIYLITTIAAIWLKKYARIFVLGYYLFVEAHSLETDNVRGQISEHIFAPNGGYCLYRLSPFNQSKS